MQDLSLARETWVVDGPGPQQQFAIPVLTLPPAGALIKRLIPSSRGIFVHRAVFLRRSCLVGAALLFLLPASARLAAASPSRAGSDSLATRAVTTPNCTAAELVVWLDTAGNGAAGSVYYTLNFTNLSGRTCALFGYPGVSAIALAGQQLGSAASRSAAHPTRTVRLATGKSASITLQIVQAANFPNATCHRTVAAGLRVYPPNQTVAKTVPFPFAACARSGPTYLTVTPL
jgi:Protein of unknown function (DUF4232)